MQKKKLTDTAFRALITEIVLELDGAGIVITDTDLINSAMNNYGEFDVMIETIATSEADDDPSTLDKKFRVFLSDLVEHLDGQGLIFVDDEELEQAITQYSLGLENI